MGLNQRTDDRANDGTGTEGRPTPRHGRAALLRLAAWFEEAAPDRADALACAAYGLHPAVYLEGRVDEGVAATTSWWQAPPDRSTVIEAPGTRPPEPVRDHRAQQARLRDAAESSAHWRRAGAAQVRSLLTEPTRHNASLDLSGAGMEVLMDLLTAALGSGDASRGPASAGDLEFSLRLHVLPAPGAEVTVRGEGGELTLEGVRLVVTPYEQHTVEETASEPDGTSASADPRGPEPVPEDAPDTPVEDPEPAGTLPEPAPGTSDPESAAGTDRAAEAAPDPADPTDPSANPPGPRPWE